MQALVISESESIGDELTLLLNALDVANVQASGSEFDAAVCDECTHCEVVFFAPPQGFDVAHQIETLQRENAERPIVLVIDAARRTDIVDALHAGCSDYLLTPVTPSAMCDKLEKWCGLASAPRFARRSQLAPAAV